MNYTIPNLEEFLKERIYTEYSYTAVQLEMYKDILDWKQISANEKINWSYEIVKKFEDFLNWDVLPNNKSITDKMTLGLLFPDRAELAKCNCSFQYDFCECENQNWYNGNWERGLFSERYEKGSGINNTIIDLVLNDITSLAFSDFTNEMLEEILVSSFIEKEYLKNDKNGFFN